MASCASSHTLHYKIGTLSSPWRPLRLGGGQRAFHHPQGGAIFASASCNVSDADAPLDVLTNHLLFQLQDIEEQGREPLTLDGRAALRTRVRATLDGVPIALELVVLKKDGCSVDLQLAASPATIASRRADFERFMRGFAVERHGS